MPPRNSSSGATAKRTDANDYALCVRERIDVVSSGSRHLPRHAPFLDHETPVLHDLDPSLGQPLGGFIIADSELKPHAFGLHGQDFVDVLRDVLRPAENV